MTQEELLLKLSVSMTGMKEVIRQYEELIESTKDTQVTIRRLGKEYSDMIKVNKLLHNGVTDTKTKMAMLETTIKSLISNGVKPASKEVQSLTNQYKKLQEQQSKAGKDGGSDGFFGEIAQGILGANVAMGIFNKTIEAVIFTIKTGFDFNRMMESSQMALGVMFRSQETAISLIGQFKTLSAQTGISLQDASEGAKQLSAYGFGADTLVDNMKMLGTVSKAVGTSLGDLTYVYGTLRSQGRAYTRDLMQFAMRGIPIYEELGAVLGVDGSQIKKMAEDGKIGFKEVEMAFKNMTSEGGKFAGMLEKAMDTVDGKLAKLDNNFKQFSGNLVNNDIAKGFLDVANGVMEDSNAIKTGQALVKSSMQAINKEMEKSDNLAKKVYTNFIAMYTEGDFQAKKFLEDVNNQNLALEAQGAEYANLIRKARELQGLTPGGAVKKGGTLPFSTKDVTSLTERMTAGKKSQFNATSSDSEDAKSSAEILRANMENMIKSASRNGAELNRVVALFQDKYRTEWTESVKVVSATLGLTQEQYDGLIADASQFSNRFQDIIGRVVTGADGLAQTVTSDVTNAVRGATDAFNAIPREGFKTVEEYAQAQSDSAKGIIEQLKEDLLGIATMKKSTLKNKEDIELADAYIAKLNEMIDYYQKFVKTGSGGAKVTAVVADNFWQQYIANRKNVDITKEGLAIQQKLFEVIGIALTGNAELDQINLKYKELIQKVNEATLSDDEKRLRVLALQNEQLAEQKKTYEDIYNKAKASKGGRTEAQGKIEEEAGKQIQLLQKAMQDVLDNKDSTAEDKTKAQWGAGMKIQAIINKAEFDKIIAGSEIPMIIEGMKMLGYNLRDLGGKLANDLGGLLQFSSNLINNAFTAMTPAIKWLGDHLDTATREGIKVIGGVLGGAGSAIGGAVKGAGDMLGVAGKGIGDFMSPILNAIGGVMTTIGTTIMPFIQPIIDMVGGAFGGIVNMVMSAMGSMGNLMKIIDPLSTIFEGFLEIMLTIDDALKPVVQMLKNVGKAIAVVIMPVLMVVAMVLSSFAEGVNSILEPFLALFGVVNEQADAVEEQNKKLEDLYDKNLKSLQDLYNVGAISGKEYEARLAMMGDRPEDSVTASSMVSMSEGMQELLALCKPFFEFVKGVGVTIGNMIVSALSGAMNVFGGLGTMIAGIFSGDGNMIAKGFQMMIKGLIDILLAPINLVIAGINGMLALIDNIPGIDPGRLEPIVFPGFAVGTANLPQDTMAQVHKGEGIIPATFMESIRRGDLSLSGGKDSNSNVQPIVVNVYGTVTSERDLVKFIAKELPKASKLGYV